MLQILTHKRPLFYDIETLFWGPAKIDNLRLLEGYKIKFRYSPQPSESEKDIFGRDHKANAKSIFGVGKGALGREHKTRKIALIGKIRKCEKGIREPQPKKWHVWKDEWVRGGDGAAEDCKHYKLLNWWGKYLFWQGNLGIKLELNYSFSRLKLIVLKFKFFNWVKVVSEPKIIKDFYLLGCFGGLVRSGKDSGVWVVTLQYDVRYLFKIIGMKANYFR